VANVLYHKKELKLESKMLEQISFEIKRKFVTHIILFILFSFGFGNKVIAQGKIDISSGIGFPELLNLGLRFQLKQAQFGIKIGSVPVEDESIISISGDLYYHFGGYSKFSYRRPWYWRVGLNYLRDETESLNDKYLYLNLRLGRDLNVSKKFGINIDAGAIFELFHEKEEKKRSWLDLDIDIPIILPSIGIGLFYRI
jgi:hypothetical protein